MGGTASKGKDPPPHRSSQTERKQLLQGSTFADLTEVSEEHQTACKHPVGDTDASGGRQGRRGTRPVHRGRATESPGDSDGIYPPDSASDGRSNDSDVLSIEPTDTGPISSLAGGYFVNPETGKPSENHHGPRARGRYVYPKDRSYDKLSSDELISKLRESKIPTQRSDITQCILTVTIPVLAISQSFAEISSFLKINNTIICSRVHSELMKFLYSSDDDFEPNQILAIEDDVWTKLRQMQDRVFDLGLINLLLWSYLLCHPDVQEKHVDEIIYTSEERKKSIQEFRKETQSTMSKDLFKAMLAFHEDFPKRFRKRGGLSLGRDVQNTCDKRDDETLNLVDKAKFCDKFTHLYSLIKQIMASEHDCGNIVVYLKHILPSLIGKGRCGKTQTLSMLLDQGLNHALRSVFGQADVQIGPVHSKTKRDLQELIVTTIVNQTKKSSMSSFLSWLNIAKYKRCCENRLRYILLEFSSLIFHQAKCVRDPVHKILRQFSRQSMLQMHIREMERSQANCGLCIVPHTETDTYCQTLKGRMGNHKVIIHAHVPSYEDLHNPHTGNHFPPNMQSERDRHINNLDMLRRIKSHNNIVELYAYQAKPLPWYYIIEDCQQTTLQRVVLENRESNSWLSDKYLCNCLFDIVNGLSHLHKQNIVLRDLTLNNFFWVNDRVKIGDLSVACVYKSKNNTPVRDLYPEDIPTRWTSPEALLDGTFSPQSDIWSLGLVMYVLWTHACEPYTEHYGVSTEEVMRKVVFEELPPFHWSCIPDCVYVLLRQCVKKNSGERIELAMLSDELEKCSKTLGEAQTYSDTSETTFEEIHARDLFYPVLSEEQNKRHHLPERGIPDFIHEFRKELKEGFVNSSRRNWMWTVPVVSSVDLKGQNDLILETSSEGMTVKETLTEEFVKKRRPHIEAADIKALNTGPATLDKHGPNHYIQQRSYEHSDTLLEVALHRIHDSDVMFGVDSNINRYLHMCLQVAESVLDMHRKGWIHRNLRAKNFLVNRKTREVYTCRVGGILQVPVTETGTGIVKDSVSEHSSRWLPPEVLIQGIYSKAGDVYMLAMMIYEVLQAYQEDNPRKDIISVPYCLVPQRELKMVKQKGDFDPLPRPDSCPEWLYDFLVRCWNPDRCERPTIQTVVHMLRERLGGEIRSHEERLMMRDQLPPPPTPPGPSGQPRRKSRIDGRSPFNRFRKFGKTMKKLFRAKRNPEPEAIDNLENTETEHSYATFNHGFSMEEGGEALYEVLLNSQDDDVEEDDVIYDRLASRRNTMLRSITFPEVPDHEIHYDDNNRVSSIRMRLHRGRRYISKKKSKKRQMQMRIRSPVNHSSSSSSNHPTTIRRHSKRRKTIGDIFRLPAESSLPENHVSKSPDNEEGDGSPFHDDGEQSSRKTPFRDDRGETSRKTTFHDDREETSSKTTFHHDRKETSRMTPFHDDREETRSKTPFHNDRKETSRKTVLVAPDKSGMIAPDSSRRRVSKTSTANGRSLPNEETETEYKTVVTEVVGTSITDDPGGGSGSGAPITGGRIQSGVPEGEGGTRPRLSERKTLLGAVVGEEAELISRRAKREEGRGFRSRHIDPGGGNEASGGRNGRASRLVRHSIINDSSESESASRCQSLSPVRQGNAGDISLPPPQFGRARRIHDNTFINLDKERRTQSENTVYLTVCDGASGGGNLSFISQERTFVEGDDLECDDGYMRPVSQTGTSIECDDLECDHSCAVRGKVNSVIQSRTSISDDDLECDHSCTVSGKVRSVTKSRTSISDDDLECDHSNSSTHL